ncbi:HutD family protein [Clostridium sp. CS001]|uniref:HutD/Ves family protein n=1 Tax=Clostridium sp. CS001 TaxID=2880648 RepID=UPI001CF5086F|nr:HutD family protein [Clostridium sp. CS001]MCB2288331.1 HutD family protein [Clostridium sp. CS001]
MSYSIEVIRKKQHKTSNWSGGTTTELYIYPEDAVYSKRNFKWRLSSAKVEVEKSTFTLLPGISRLIMIVEGELILEHEGHHNATLKEFQQDSFSGDWTTTSFGRVTDFNLMITEGYKGNLEEILIKALEFKDIFLCNNTNNALRFSQIVEAFYIVKGDVEMDMMTSGKINLNEGDLVLITRTGKEIDCELKIHSSSGEGTRIIKASILLKI